MPIIFVHGVSVRQERFEELLKIVRDKIALQCKELRVEGFYWGDEGASLRCHGASIPGFLEGVRAIDSPALPEIPELDQDQLKALLLDEPYLEFIALRDAEEFDPAGAGFIPIPSEVRIRNQSLYLSQPEISAALQNDHQLSVAMGKIVAGDTIEAIVGNAFNQAGYADRRYGVGDLIDPLIRCLTAALYEATLGQDDTLDTEFVWTDVEGQLQRILERQLGGQRGRIGDTLKNAALSAATVALRRGWRRRIMKKWSLFIGDVLVYLARRELVLQKFESVVAEVVKSDRSPLWLVGHSLGGIICYDYCSQTVRNVERLVTVGSQVGLFGELGSLRSPVVLDEGKIPVPDRIGSWINIYDPDDMLSFRAEPVFTKVVDIVVDTTAPFPISHSEYWNRPEVYEKMTRKFQ